MEKEKPTNKTKTKPPYTHTQKFTSRTETGHEQHDLKRKAEQVVKYVNS